MLAALFALLIPTTIEDSFRGTDAKSTDPSVQVGNLKAIVASETPKDRQTKELREVVRAMEVKRKTDEDAAAVYAAAKVELHEKLTPDDVILLAASKRPARRTVAALYSEPPPNPQVAKALVESLPSDRYLYNLARAQTLERLGDRSGRRSVSPEIDPIGSNSKLNVIGAIVLLGLLIGAGVLLAYAYALGTGMIKWQGHPLEPPNLIEADRLAVRAAQLFGAFLLIELFVVLAATKFGVTKSPMGELLVEVVASACVIAGTVALTFLPIGRRFIRLPDYGFGNLPLLHSFLWGLGGLFAVAPIAFMGLLIGSIAEHVSPRADHPLMHALEDPHNIWAFAGALFLASLQAPFTEELLFRGTLIPALSGSFRAKRHPALLAIATSSLLFAAIHPQGFTLWLALASVGVVNGVLCYQTRSVLPGMIMHALFNGATLTLALLAR
ncbi:MAG TPA: type II CAAX endopeptidase family protein [Fimbriimonadaceae bacterium]|nr:type II CAAX endopeptidase family protein [Fimbriimonadaceae bacterium]